MKNLTLILLTIFCLSACGTTKKVGSSAELPSYGPTILPQDIEMLWLSEGNESSDTVLLVCQSGPKAKLEFAEKRRSSHKYLPNFREYQIVHLHQAQTWNAEIYTYEDVFNYSMAERENRKSTEILARAIKHFKKRGSTVLVIGESFGAYLISSYLANYESKADGYIVLGARLDSHLQQTHQQVNGHNGKFKPDGITYIPESDSDISMLYEEELRLKTVNNVLNGAIAKPNYTEVLEDKDLSKLTYVYASNDEVVGQLTGTEIRFLRDKGATVVATDKGHGELLNEFISRVITGELEL